MNLYSQMQSLAEPSYQADEPLQRELQILLRQLNWSYVAIWTFNYETSKLEWTGGHFRVNSTAVIGHDDAEVWNEHLFNNTYKSCTFAPGQGCVGMAYAEVRNIWINSLSVHHSAGSKEQAQFLQQAGIETVVYIPSAESVLEVGTCKYVAENQNLSTYMWYFLSEHILPSLAQVPPKFSQSLLAASRDMMQFGSFPFSNPTRHLSDKFLNQDIELNTVNDHIRRSSSLSSLNIDMFLQSEEGEAVNDLTELSTGLEPGIVLKDTRWSSPTATSRDTGIQLQKHTPSIRSAPNQALLSARVQNSGTTSPSVSISEEGSGRLSPSPRRSTPSHSPEVYVRDISTDIISPTRNLRVEDMLEEREAEVDTRVQWRNSYMNTAREASDVEIETSLLDPNALPNLSAFLTEDELPERAFEPWQHPRVSAPVFQRKSNTNQALHRLCLELLKRGANLQQENQTDAAVMRSNTGPGELRQTSSSANPEVLPVTGFAHNPSDQAASLRRQRLQKATIGLVHSTHHKAAVKHMLAERRRRIKQKENFSALRKLVPVISKADKASTLGDAIAHIKELNERIRELESSGAQRKTRYEDLKKAYQVLERRNKELEVMVAARDGAGTSQMQQQSSPRLQSTRHSV